MASNGTLHDHCHEQGADRHVTKYHLHFRNPIRRHGFFVAAAGQISRIDRYAVSFSVRPFAHFFIDKETRDKAVKHLALFLSNPENNALPDIEIAKLWKGLFYCKSSFSVPHQLHHVYPRLLDVRQAARTAGPRSRVGRTSPHDHQHTGLTKLSQGLLDHNGQGVERNRPFAVRTVRVPQSCRLISS